MEPYYNPYDPNRQKPGSSGFAIASLVLGIVGVLLCCFYYIALPCGVVGLVLGILAIRQGGANKTMAIIGTILSGVAIFLFFVILVLMIFGAAIFSAGMLGSYSGGYYGDIFTSLLH